MLPGFEVIPATNAGGSFNGSPWKLCLHTTEGSSIEGAVGAYRVNTGWPHITCDPARRRKAQHYELNLSSRALAHPSGTPETNRAGIINIEIVGFAAQTGAWPKDWLAWLAADVFAPVRAVCPFALAAPLFVAYPSSYGLGASQRFSRAMFAGYSGIIGHQHVPDNDHGDPGALDVATIIATLGGATPVPSPTRRYKVNAILDDPVSGETSIAELRDDGIVWLRNIKTGSAWYNAGPLPANAGKAVSMDAGYRRDGTLDVSVRTDKGVVWINGVPSGGRFGGWYVPG